MKILKSIMLGVAMVATFGVANAAKLSGDPVLTEQYVINTYVAAVSQGDIKAVNKILDDNATFSALQNKDVVTFTKQDFLDNLKANEGVKQDCTTTTTLDKQTADNTVYKVEMKYADHTQTNWVTMIGTENGWKISGVYTEIK